MKVSHIRSGELEWIVRTTTTLLCISVCSSALMGKNLVMAFCPSVSLVAPGHRLSDRSSSNIMDGRKNERLCMSSIYSDNTEETSAVTDADNDDNKNSNVERRVLLPELFPAFSTSLRKLGYTTPTPIQRVSASRALDEENLLLIAPTGSGKTLAYMLPALSRAIARGTNNMMGGQPGTVLVVAPTRELAVQWMRDTVSLLEAAEEKDENTNASSSVVLCVRGVDIPTPKEMNGATVLIGTPPELLNVIMGVNGGQEFVAGDVLSTVILDEVDVLLPNLPKAIRTSLDSSAGGGGNDRRRGGRADNDRVQERRKQEQRRKLKATKRRGTEISNSMNVVSPTDKILSLIATRRFAGGELATPCQVLAGSATASRRTLDRLNRALRDAAAEASSASIDVVWNGDVTVCRPPVQEKKEEEKDSMEESTGDNEQLIQHTIRSVLVPEQVRHQYISLDRDTSSSSQAVLSMVAKATALLKPRTALLFLCGEFGTPNPNRNTEKKRDLPTPKGATSKARRNAQNRQKQLALSKQKSIPSSSTARTTLSARQACKTLREFGMEALPLHVALGLELNAEEHMDSDSDDSTTNTTPPFLVTFEGSARGLHFDAVDTVFVVGRPTSAASYLHLAGRVGRASPNTTADGTDGSDVSGEVTIRPGTVVSLCTKGQAKELEKWTRQIGGNTLEELIL